MQYKPQPGYEIFASVSDSPHTYYARGSKSNSIFRCETIADERMRDALQNHPRSVSARKIMKKKKLENVPFFIVLFLERNIELFRSIFLNDNTKHHEDCLSNGYLSID